MRSLRSVEAQFCMAHVESKGCFTFLDPCSISTYVSFKSLLQIIFCGFPLLSKKNKTKKRLGSPYFPAPLFPACKHAQDESLHNYIPIACILPLALPFRSFHAYLPIKPIIWGLIICWGSLTPGKIFSSSLGDTWEPPAHITISEGRLNTALHVQHPLICLEILSPALGS